MAKPLVDARQLTAAEIEARFAGVDFAVPRTLPQALAVFWSNPSIQIISAGLLAILGARVAAHAPLTPGEALAVPVTVAGWVVQEWAIHRHLLHGALRWPGAAIHQQHHELPFYHVSIDPPAIVLAWGAVACAAALALLPQPLAWTVLGVRWKAASGLLSVCVFDWTDTMTLKTQTYWLMGLVYEWSHYIVHTRVRPATKLGRAIKEHHTRYSQPLAGNEMYGWRCRYVLKLIEPHHPFPKTGTTCRTTASGSPSPGRPSTRSSTRCPKRQWTGAAKAERVVERASGQYIRRERID